MKIKDFFTKSKIKMKKNAPEIMVIYGVTGLVASSILSVIGYKKAKPVVEEFKERRKNYKELKNEVDNQTDLDKKEIIKTYADAGLKLTIIYGPIILLEASSVYGVLKSHGMLKKENIALTGIISGLRTSFNSYRQKVVDRYGEGVDKELYYDLQTIGVTEKDENGEEVRKDIQTTGLKSNPGNYIFIFDRSCPGWHDDEDINHQMFRIKLIEEMVESRLTSARDGYKFYLLSHVLEEIGIKEEDFPKGWMTAGWVYDPDVPIGDTHVKFEMIPIKQEIEGSPGEFEDVLLLDLNCDGDLSFLI